MDELLFSGAGGDLNSCDRAMLGFLLAAVLLLLASAILNYVNLNLAMALTPMMNRLLNDPSIAVRIRFTPALVTLAVSFAAVVWQVLSVTRANPAAMLKKE